MFTLKNLRLTGYVEGTSLLLLIGIAMPVKYMLGEPMLVRVIGMIHGLLFMWYVVLLALTVSRNALPWWTFPAGFIGAVIPFGPFLFEYLLSKATTKTSIQ
jgi:integral membrane protein